MSGAIEQAWAALTSQGPEHPATATSLEIYESVLGTEHRETTTSLHILSGYYREQGELETARHRLDRVLRLPEQPKPSEMAGWTHPYYCTALTCRRCVRAMGSVWAYSFGA